MMLHQFSQYFLAMCEHDENTNDNQSVLYKEEFIPHASPVKLQKVYRRCSIREKGGAKGVSIHDLIKRDNTALVTELNCGTVRIVNSLSNSSNVSARQEEPQVIEFEEDNSDDVVITQRIIPDAGSNSPLPLAFPTSSPLHPTSVPITEPSSPQTTMSSTPAPSTLTSILQNSAPALSSPLYEAYTRHLTSTDTSHPAQSPRPDIISNISEAIESMSSPLSKDSEDTYLYLSQEMYNKLITSGLEDDKDITFNCIETTTKEGFRVLVYNSSKHHTDIDTLWESSTLDKLLFQLPALITEPNKSSVTEEACCKVCGVVFGGLKKLQIHQALYHSTGANTLLHCWVCERNCEKISEYLSHVKEEHPEAMAKCPVCGHVTGSTKSLAIHIKNSHFNKPKYSCEYCEAKFRSPHTKQYHIRDKHQQTPNTNKTCTVCLKVFQQQRSLVRHMKHIHGGKREVCGVCDQTYSSLSALYVHQRSKHSQVSYRCGFCSLSFKTTSSVNKHQTEMHNVARTFSQAVTEHVSTYVHVTGECKIVKRERRGESTMHITCQDCHTEFTCHDAFTKHCQKFHDTDRV